MAFYRKKPVAIEAEQFTGDNFEKIVQFIGEENLVSEEFDTDISKEFPVTIQIKTLEGYMYASRYDYIIKGIKGEFYPCKPDIFYKTYEPALYIQFGNRPVCPKCKIALDMLNDFQDHYHCPNCGAEYIVHK